MFLIWFYVENNVLMTSVLGIYIDSPGGFFSRQRLEGEEEEGDDDTVEMNHDHLHLIVMKWNKTEDFLINTETAERSAN